MRILTLALLCAGPGTALAQAPPLTADEAVALAVKQNPRLSAAAREIGAARSGVRSAGALANPSVTFTPGLIGPLGSDEELLLQQPLELNGSRSARRGVARAQLRQAQAEAIVELRDVVFQTRNAYYELARGQELRAVARDALRIAEEFDRGVRRQAEEGLRPGIDPVQTGLEVNRARQQLTLAESRVTGAAAALNTLMGRAAATPIGALPALALVPEEVGRDAALKQALASRAEIAAQEALRESFRQQARLARREGLPDLTPQFRASSVTRGFSDSGIGLGITLPFLDYGSRRNRVRQAEQTAQAQEARITSARNQVGQEVEQALARLQASGAVVRSYQQGVLDQARRLLEGAQRSLQLGAPNGSILAVLEAQRTYRGVLSEYTNALADYAQARAELDRATGAVSADLLPGAERSRMSQQGRPQ